jgi:folate-binding protein YgfZ
MFLDTYKEEGVRLADAFGVSYPETFSHPVLEYRALVSHLAAIDLTHWGALRLTGSDRATFLDAMITAEVAKLEPGQAAHAALTTTKGKLVAELYVLSRESELLVLVAQGDRAAVAATLAKHIVADDVELEDASAGIGVLAVEGPRCRDLVWRLFPDAAIPMEALRFVDVDYQGIPVTILRASVTGERGFQMIVPADGIARIRDYLVQAGRGLDLALAGRAAWNLRRVEAGLPWFGVDAGDTFPKECRLDHLVRYDKGCFLGQETLARMHFRGHPNWLLEGVAPADDAPGSLAPPAPLALDDDALAAAACDPETLRTHLAALDLSRLSGAELFAPGQAADDAKPVGRITSAVFSPARGSLLALASVRAAHAQARDDMEMITGGEPVRLALTELPATATS